MLGELVSLLFLRSKQCRADLQALTDVQNTHGNRLALGNYTPGLDPEHAGRISCCDAELAAQAMAKMTVDEVETVTSRRRDSLSTLPTTRPEAPVATDGSDGYRGQIELH